MLYFGIGLLFVVILIGLLLPVKRTNQKVAAKKTVDNTDTLLSKALTHLKDVGYIDEDR